MWPFRTKPKRGERLSIRELREALTLTTDDDRVWLLDRLAGAAPTATEQALKDLTRMKDHAAAGGWCLKCGKTWPRPTVPAYADGVHGFVCDDAVCNPEPEPLALSVSTQPIPALTTPQGDAA
ncbi:hypothetical protein [Actinomadura madurae]|uniref:hypothetical protein n=1 Tax=Actinomadura madurae TaxID=1993 RepID=UPI0020D2022C|nr:hypothetical protein [Actinomadura madurae]MCP9947177.1 hypothetical protein [Actinomadura madurae]MCP9963943.1 hypothetical protein [Actinomadura madurae]MCQ0012090.1 hypothetical protein [Actinomadura madurae]MCQ0012610.1 hypothetical protein [Actinomadura madurae]